MKLNIIKEIKPYIDKIQANLNKTQVPIKQGKNLRSYLGLLLLRAHDIEIDENHILFLTGIELIQTASLFHDDVIDNDETRRNTDKNENNKVNIIKGDMTISEALNYLIKINNIQIIENVNNTITKMCDGELLQQKLLNKIPTLKEYLYKTELKTASLFQVIGACISILSGTEYKDILEFLYNFGMAYQIKNDLKDVNSDIKNGIYTAPIIFSNGLDIKKSGIEKTISLIDNYQRGAIKSLKIISGSIYKSELSEVTKCLKQ